MGKIKVKSTTDRVIVLGDGKLGLLVAQVLTLSGCQLTVVGKHPEKLEILKRFEIDTKLIHERIYEKADVVVDCTGAPQGFEDSMKYLRPKGILVLKSTFRDPIPFNPSSLVIDEITLLGSRCGPFQTALQALKRGGLLHVLPLISASYPLEMGVEAFGKALEKKTIKVLIKC